MENCVVPFCGRKEIHEKNLCSAHYQRFLKHGDTFDDVPIKKQRTKYQVKRCANHLCGRLMYSEQYNFDNKYCSKDCVIEMDIWKTVTNKEYIKRYKLINPFPRTERLFPHKWLPVILEIPE